MRFGEPNLVLSERVHENSRILYHRDPALRVEKVAPWLTVDSDPFPAVVDGRVVWLLDGYTVTDRYPMSQKGSFDEMTDDSLANDSTFQTLPSDEINYIRNAIKATVDAYDGTVTLYAWDEEDPILRAWMGAFPGTVQPRSEIPEAVLEHLRYPEDMFKVQRYQLGAYHVLDAGDFYEANDRWEVPTDPNNPASLQPPYRLSVPSSDAADMFSLTSVYTPVNRENLAAFVSVDADAVEDSYGTIRVKRLSSSSQIPGPGQIANQIQSDQAVTQALLPYTRETNTHVVNGNLLTLPVGEGLLYVQPLYSLRTSGEGNFPVLRFTAVSFGQEVGVGRTLGEAIYDVLNLPGTPSDSPADGSPPDNGDPSEPDDEPTGSPQKRVQNLLNRSDAKFEEADAALAEGDLGGYQDAVSRGPRSPTPGDRPGGGRRQEPLRDGGVRTGRVTTVTRGRRGPAHRASSASAGAALGPLARRPTGRLVSNAAGSPEVYAPEHPVRGQPVYGAGHKSKGRRCVAGWCQPIASGQRISRADTPGRRPVAGYSACGQVMTRLRLIRLRVLRAAAGRSVRPR